MLVVPVCTGISSYSPRLHHNHDHARGKTCRPKKKRAALWKFEHT